MARERCKQHWQAHGRQCKFWPCLLALLSLGQSPVVKASRMQAIGLWQSRYYSLSGSPAAAAATGVLLPCTSAPPRAATYDTHLWLVGTQRLHITRSGHQPCRHTLRSRASAKAVTFLV